jgi:hypothetical protein
VALKSGIAVPVAVCDGGVEGTVDGDDGTFVGVAAVDDEATVRGVGESVRNQPIAAPIAANATKPATKAKTWPTDTGGLPDAEAADEGDPEALT